MLWKRAITLRTVPSVTESIIISVQDRRVDTCSLLLATRHRILSSVLSVQRYHGRRELFFVCANSFGAAHKSAKTHSSSFFLPSITLVARVFPTSAPRLISTPEIVCFLFGIDEHTFDLSSFVTDRQRWNFEKNDRNEIYYKRRFVLSIKRDNEEILRDVSKYQIYMSISFIFSLDLWSDKIPSNDLDK